jgi:hypothetical protein
MLESARWNKLMNAVAFGVPVDEAIESDDERPYRAVSEITNQ